MKNKHFKYIVVLAIATATSMNACQLNEYNPSTVSLDIAYKNKEGFDGLINACYTDLYYFHGKIDFIGPSEMGTDLWVNYGTSESGLTTYDNTLSTLTGSTKVVWNGLYSIVNFCNTAIYYGKDVKGYATQEDLNRKLAEAHFLRAYANFNLVELFGNTLLKTTSSAVDGFNPTPKRNTEKEFYDLIFSDLKFACENLPVTQDLRGRVTKKAAYALLAKAYLQRTRLGDVQEYAQLALTTAQELINNPAKYNCALYTSDATKSGFAKLWAGKNNKTNTEFLFTQAIDPASGNNPEGWNRGRTRQYFLPDLGGRGAEWGTQEKSVLYGRSNSKYFKPSKYLLTSVFEPSATTPDTRFAETFTYKFYANANTTITQNLINTYGKDQSLLNHIIYGTTNSYVGPDYFWSWGAKLEEEKNMDNDKGLAVFTPNWTIDVNTKKMMPMLVVDPSDLFDPNTGNYKKPADYPGQVDLTNIFPAFKKFSSKMWDYTNQYWMGDIPIIRLGDVYLIAAEAAILDNKKPEALIYVNAIRDRAALSGNQAQNEVGLTDMTIDFIAAERARELAGEHMRWFDLKRMGKLTKSYLSSTNPVVGSNFRDDIHTKRPIPQSFLDAISNSAEFGTNGY
nr:RagB/SusD family nutrient uptake outer membrane protein [uncultured Pedobacter sp.]